MVVYKKKVSTRHSRFRDRNITIIGGRDATVIPVDDTEVICNSCNGNIYSEKEESFGWLIYLSKNELKADRPYDIYCEDCVKRSFPKAVEA